jgi:hypothetical protein
MLRIVFLIFVIIHGLMHLIGFVREVEIPMTKKLLVKAIIPISDLDSKVFGVLWLIGGLAMILSTITFLMGKHWWWIIAAVTLVLSQSLIILYWSDAKYGSLVNLIILIAVLLLYHEQRFYSEVRKDINELMASQTKTSQSIITHQSLKDLPLIVQKWLVKSNVIGKKSVHSLQLKQKGMMRTSGEGNWMQMTSEQFITVDNPGFVWNAGIKANPFMTINGRDKLSEGRGSMIIKALHTIPIANSTGKEIDQGAMMRYLAEIIWNPSAALKDYMRWEYVSDTSARAFMNCHNAIISGLFSFNKDGDIKGFEGKRYGDFDDHYSLETWSIAVTGYKEFEGIRIGNKSEVTWKLKKGNFTWLRTEVTDIKYNLDPYFMMTDSEPISDNQAGSGNQFYLSNERSAQIM